MQQAYLPLIILNFFGYLKNSIWQDLTELDKNRLKILNLKFNGLNSILIYKNALLSNYDLK